MHAAEFKGLPPVVLASASPRRAQLLRQVVLDFKVVASHFSELKHEQLTACETAKINAYRKARSVAEHAPDALVIGADTVVAIDTLLLGKPADLNEASRMLGQLQNRTHIVVTGIGLIWLRRHRQVIFSERTEVTFRPLDAVAIGRYLAKVNPLDKAGAYGIQEQGELIIDRIEGSYTNVVGLPLERLKSELGKWFSTAAPLRATPFMDSLPEPRN